MTVVNKSRFKTNSRSTLKLVTACLVSHFFIFAEFDYRAEQKVVINPFCKVFPTEVSCTVPNIGAAGGEQNHNGLCILSQNIINEKMYLAIWFWLIILMILR
jgi:hypothetical protein